MSKPAVIELDHFYKHPLASVWKALTDPVLFARWWAAGDIRPVVSHKFDLDMGAFGKQPCEVLRVENEKLLQIRFATTSLNTTITFEIASENGGTRLKLTHGGFNLDHPMGRQAYEGMKNGWPSVLDRMELVLR